MTRRKLLNLWPLTLLGAQRSKPAIHQAPTMQQLIHLAENGYEVVVTNEDITRNLGRDEAEEFFRLMVSRTWGPMNAVELRHEGKVIKRARGTAVKTPLGQQLGRAVSYSAPTMQQLIDLTESAPRQAQRVYYGRILALALRTTGRIAKTNSNGSVSLYWAAEEGRGLAWNKETVRGSSEVVPEKFLQNFRPENRGLGFPEGTLYKPL